MCSLEAFRNHSLLYSWKWYCALFTFGFASFWRVGNNVWLWITSGHQWISPAYVQAPWRASARTWLNRFSLVNMFEIGRCLPQARSKKLLRWQFWASRHSYFWLRKFIQRWNRCFFGSSIQQGAYFHQHQSQRPCSFRQRGEKYARFRHPRGFTPEVIPLVFEHFGKWHHRFSEIPGRSVYRRFWTKKQGRIHVLLEKMLWSCSPEG